MRMNASRAEITIKINVLSYRMGMLMARSFLVLLATMGCVRQRPAGPALTPAVPWQLSDGSAAVSLCDGGVFADEEEPGDSSGGEISGKVSAMETHDCMQVMRREYGEEWTHRVFVFEFSTDDAGVVQHVCALRVPSAPQAATCTARLVEKTGFPAGLSNTRYRFHFFLD